MKIDIYECVTNQIIAELEKGNRPWIKPWDAALSLPKRSTGEAYRGANIILLWIAELSFGYRKCRYMTFKQAQELKGSVRKGEKGHMVVKYGTFTPKDAPATATGDAEQKIPYLKGYTVFNVEQIDGLPEKSLAQNIGQPSLVALSFIIEANRKEYYEQLQRSQKTLDITEWLVYFSQTILAAQITTRKRLQFYISKTRFYDRYRGTLNERQEKAIARIFREGYTGFEGGLNAQNYISITHASRATTTRDLQDLVEKGALLRTGERRQTRYWLNLFG